MEFFYVKVGLSFLDPGFLTVDTVKVGKKNLVKENLVIENFYFITEYMVPLYNIENVKNISNSEIKFTNITTNFFLETLPTKIRGKPISYTSYKNKLNISTENELIKDLDRINKDTSLNIIEKDTQLEDKNKELEEIRQLLLLD